MARNVNRLFLSLCEGCTLQDLRCGRPPPHHTINSLTWNVVYVQTGGEGSLVPRPFLPFLVGGPGPGPTRKRKGLGTKLGGRLVTETTSYPH